MTTTPHEAPATDPHLDEVVESLERGLTLLKRRTRDVIKLAREREELIAAIENRPSRVQAEPAGATPDSDVVVHGESSAFDLSDETPNFDPGDIGPLAESTARAPATDFAYDEPQDHAAAEAETADDEPTVSNDLAAYETEAATDEPSEFPGSPETGEPVEAHGDTELASSPANNKWARPTVEATRHEDIRDTTEHTEPAWDSAAAAEIENDADQDVTTDEPDAWTTPVESSQAASWESDTPLRDNAESSDRAWENPDLEWSDEQTETVPHDFSTPAAATGDDLDDVTPAAVDTWGADADDAWGTDADDAWGADAEGAVPSATGVVPTDDSPFAAEFEEHVEEVGGSLDKPFDLDTPPQQASYRPRSLQGGRHDDAVSASSLLSSTEAGPSTAPHQPTENLEAAWDDFAGPSDTTTPDRAAVAPDDSASAALDESPSQSPASGSRLRDLVAQAQQSERERTAQEKSDFDLIHEDPSVSRYDKNSAKLPTVGISSEELSSSVAGLRSSLTGDKKSGPSGRDDDKMSRADKKAEKRAAKEAAKAAKAEAKRKRG